MTLFEIIVVVLLSLQLLALTALIPINTGLKMIWDEIIKITRAD